MKFLSLYMAAPVSALLLACSSLYTSLYLLAWVALVPFLLSLSRCQSTSQAYKLGLLTGFFIYALSTYWVVSFIITLKAYSLITAIALACLYWFYCAQLFGLVAVFTVYLSKKWPSVWVFPLVLTVFFAFFPSLFSIQLGETQSEFLIALQGSAYTGVYGLDFIMALSNVLIAQAIVRPLSAEKKYHARLACVLVSLWFAYGVYSFNYWEAQINEGALVNVGIVQPDRGVGHNEVQVLPGYTLSYPVEMALSDALVAQGADVIAWPELPSKRYYEQEKIREAYQYQVSQWQVPLIFQDNQNQVLDGEVAKYSASTYLDAQGQQAAFY